MEKEIEEVRSAMVAIRQEMEESAAKKREIEILRTGLDKLGDTVVSVAAGEGGAELPTRGELRI